MSEFLDESNYVLAKNAELYTEIVGPRNAPAVLYLHGGPGYNSHSFRDLMGDELLTYRMIYADQRNGGRSLSSDSEASINTLSNDVEAILDAYNIERVTLLAHGYGALIALSAAQRLQERIERLILVNPWVDMRRLSRSMQREAARLSANDDLALPPEHTLNEGDFEPQEVLNQALSWIASKQLWDAMEFPKAASRLRLEHSDAEILFGSVNDEPPEDVWQQSVTGNLSELKQPTVILLGQQDKTSYPDQAELVLEAMPQALVSLLESGHYPWLDDPETFTALFNEAMQIPGV